MEQSSTLRLSKLTLEINFSKSTFKKALNKFEGLFYFSNTYVVNINYLDRGKKPRDIVVNLLDVFEKKVPCFKVL